MARDMLDTLLDTPRCLDLLKHHPHELAQRFARCYAGDVVISAITQAELDDGVVCSGEQSGCNRAAPDAFLQEVPAVPFEAAAQACGPVRLVTRKRKRGALDKPIAAHAVALGKQVQRSSLPIFY